MSKTTDWTPDEVLHDSAMRTINHFKSLREKVQTPNINLHLNTSESFNIFMSIYSSSALIYFYTALFGLTASSCISRT